MWRPQAKTGRSGARLFYPRNALIYRAGEMAAGIFCIYSGEVRVYSGLGSAAEQLIHIASPGEIVGFNSIAGGAFLNSALAATDTQICKIPLADIQQLLRLLAATAEKILNNKV